MPLHPVIRGHGINGATSPTLAADLGPAEPHPEASDDPGYTDSGSETKLLPIHLHQRGITGLFSGQMTSSCNHHGHLFIYSGTTRTKPSLPASPKPRQRLLARRARGARLYFRRCQRGQSATGRPALGKPALWRQLLFNSVLPPFQGAFYPNANSQVESHLVVAVMTKLAKNRSFS